MSIFKITRRLTLSLAALAFVFAATACAKDDVEDGPSISILLADDSGDQTDGSSDQNTLTSGGSAYNITVTITAEPGNDQNDETDFPATSVTGSITGAGVTIPDSPFTDGGDGTFTRQDPIALPASATGQVLHVHYQAADSRGLTSNIIDFDVTLD